MSVRLPGARPVDAPAPLSPRRRQLLDAALHVIADEGLRGLTHRAVDRRAGLPEGSCSAYLRTRKALLTALTEYVAVTLASDVEQLAHSLEACAELGDESQDRAVELATGLFLRWVDERELLTAKLELSLEGSRDRDLAELLESYRTQLVELVSTILAGRGKEHSLELAEAIVASYDGILAAALLKPAPARRAFLERSLGLVLHSLAGD